MNAVSSVGHPELVALSKEWLTKITAFRAARGMYGKVSVALIETPTATELHLIEETTFKAAPTQTGGSKARGKKCLLYEALEFIQRQAAERAKHFASGAIRFESEQRAGETVAVKIIETTVISRPRLDAGRLSG